MKRLALAALLLLASPLSALAAPASDAQIDRLFEVMHTRQTLDLIVPQAEAQQAQMLEQLTAGRTLTAEQRQRLETVQAIGSKRLRETLTWDKLEPLYRDIYRKTFSGEEMDGMIRFYGSPDGQAVLAKMPELMKHTMAAMQALVVPMMQDMQRDIEQAAATETRVP